MKPTTIVFAGPQGSGKGTQVALLKEFLEKKGETVVHSEAGGTFRKIIGGGSYAGKRIAETIDKGYLLPDVIPIYAFTRELFEKINTGSEHIILEGFSRKEIQAQMIDEILKFFGRIDYVFVILEVSKEESVKRLTSRAALEKRADDASLEAIERRLNLYYEEIATVTRVFESGGQRIVKVDGIGSIEEVHQRVLQTLNLA